ncbi:MAG: DUF2339 domain-containing protein [Pseudomonadales bacterium]|nr:DUF2339 domain-containing protein [Pseudomonadales bacterium]
MLAIRGRRVVDERFAQTINDPIRNELVCSLSRYSVFWLVIAIVANVWGSPVFGRCSDKAGLARFVWFIAKIHLMDMQDLEGLPRIASFLGLGMASLGVCYLHRRSQNDEPLAESEASV